MENITINQGTKMTIIPESKTGSKDFLLKASFVRWIDADHFFISAPLKDGEPFVFDKDERLSLSYGSLNTTYALEGYAIGTIKDGFRNYVKIKVENSSRKFVQRAYIRFRAEVEIKLSKFNKETNTGIEDESFLAKTIDISNGGLAVNSNIMLETDELLLITMINPAYPTKAYAIKADVCWVREASRDSSYKRLFGVKFIFDTKEEYDEVSELISDIININS